MEQHNHRKGRIRADIPQLCQLPLFNNSTEIGLNDEQTH